MFQINVKINLLCKIVLWVLGTVSHPLSIWMVWGTGPRLNYCLEMTVVWRGADSGIEFSVPGYSRHDSLLTGLFWRKIQVSCKAGIISSCPISPLQRSRDGLTCGQKLQLPRSHQWGLNAALSLIWAERTLKRHREPRNHGRATTGEITHNTLGVPTYILPSYTLINPFHDQ